MCTHWTVLAVKSKYNYISVSKTMLIKAVVRKSSEKFIGLLKFMLTLKTAIYLMLHTISTLDVTSYLYIIVIIVQSLMSICFFIFDSELDQLLCFRDSVSVT